ncbi:hypothetical protein HUJ04_009148 [Dendroctonus ponderosae]|nr:hypothetical protein HUJ04_009148 [Dendroctonus ponderosae]
MWRRNDKKRLANEAMWVFSRRFIYIKGIRIKPEYLPSMPYVQNTKVTELSYCAGNPAICAALRQLPKNH